MSAISSDIDSLCENTKPARNQSPTSVVRGFTDHIGVSSLQFCSLNNFLSARKHSSASSPHACRTRVTRGGVGHHYGGTCESINLASWPPAGLIKVDSPQPVPLVHGTTKCFEMSYIDTNLCMLSTIKQRQAVLNTVSASSMLDTRVSLYSAPARRTST